MPFFPLSAETGRSTQQPVTTKTPQTPKRTKTTQGNNGFPNHWIVLFHFISRKKFPLKKKISIITDSDLFFFLFTGTDLNALNLTRCIDNVFKF